MALKEQMVQMICKELELQKHYLGKNASIKTIYFGGGTPSLLSSQELDQILNTLHRNYRLEVEELTIETNPDDLTPEKLSDLLALGVDRLSIGIQSFNEKVLKFYNRAHTAEESLLAIDKAKNAHFEKFSIDLIYGFPHSDHGIWKDDLQKAIELDPGHISSYGLTVEPKTALGKWAERRSFTPASEDFMAEQFEMMQDELEKAGYVQYEISNFGKPGAFAIHNTNYWRGIPYLGIGPSAYSFDGKSRQHNPPNNSRYIKTLDKGSLIVEREELKKEDALNEYLLTSLRTMWGADADYIKDMYHVDIIAVKTGELNQLVQNGLVESADQKIKLTRKGKLLADSIALKLFV
jgi:oxygen-independent coproporphyrinogen-3 oxidase